MDLLSMSGATFSACNRYRYVLWREWGSGPWCNFIMLNPSTADAEVNDPTIERCVRRAQTLGCGALYVTNAFALRSTDPKALYAEADPVGPENDEAIRRTIGLCSLIICGWGEHCEKVRKGRADQIVAMIRHDGREPKALAINSSGAPKHPLYVGYAVQPQPFGRHALEGDDR